MNKEIWLKAEDGHPDRFDPLAKTLEPGSMIHVGPGTYGTRGPWLIPQGCTMKGYGDARIESSDDRIIGNQVLLSDFRQDGGITLESLTVDGKFAKIAGQITDSPRKLDCVALFGSHNRMNNVRVKGFGGTWEKGQEAFGLLMLPHNDSSGRWDTSQFDNEIRFCVADGSESGNYQNGIVGGFRGLIEDCTAQNMILKTLGHASGIGMNGGMMRRNIIKNCSWGTYLEAPCAHLTIIDNQYLGIIDRGIRVWIGAEGLLISNNLIEMAGGSDSICLEMDEKDGQSVTYSHIIHNKLKGCGQGIMLSKAAGRVQVVCNNILDPRLSVNQVARDAICLRNRTATGKLISLLPDQKRNWKSR